MHIRLSAIDYAVLLIYFGQITCYKTGQIMGYLHYLHELYMALDAT